MNRCKAFAIAAIFFASTAYADEDIAVLTADAEKGDAKAQYRLGYDYHYALGIKKDNTASLKWTLKAAEQGHIPAEYVLGIMYGYGRGVTANIREGLKWFNKAADAGSPNAQYSLAAIYENAELGVSQDRDKSKALLTKAIGPLRDLAEKGDVEAECNLGYAYQRGIGVEKDLSQSFKWFSKASENGYPVGYFYVGYAYKHGLGTTKDNKQAVKWFQKAADHGIDYAQFELARAYIYGNGVPKDLTKAYMWFDIALVQGNKAAGQGMMAIVRDMKPEQIKEAMKLSHDWQVQHLAKVDDIP